MRIVRAPWESGRRGGPDAAARRRRGQTHDEVVARAPVVDPVGPDRRQQAAVAAALGGEGAAAERIPEGLRRAPRARVRRTGRTRGGPARRLTTTPQSTSTGIRRSAVRLHHPVGGGQAPRNRPTENRLSLAKVPLIVRSLASIALPWSAPPSDALSKRGDVEREQVTRRHDRLIVPRLWAIWQCVAGRCSERESPAVYSFFGRIARPLTPRSSRNTAPGVPSDLMLPVTNN